MELVKLFIIFFHHVRGIENEQSPYQSDVRINILSGMLLDRTEKPFLHVMVDEYAAFKHLLEHEIINFCKILLHLNVTIIVRLLMDRFQVRAELYNKLLCFCLLLICLSVEQTIRTILT